MKKLNIYIVAIISLIVHFIVLVLKKKASDLNKNILLEFRKAVFSLNDSAELLRNEDFDADFHRQEQIFRVQSALRVALNKNPEGLDKFHYAVVPEILCPSAVRLGNVSDAAKWICNPWRLRPGCIVFSFGTGASPLFEEDLVELTQGRCKLFIAVLKTESERTFENVSNFRLLPYKLGAKTNLLQNEMNFTDLLNSVQESFVDILKMNIRGAEHVVLAEILRYQERTNTTLFCQLLIEIRSNSGREYARLMLKISKADYLLYAKEMNPYCIRNCVEYSYIHKSCLREFGLASEFIIQRDFIEQP